MRSGKLDLEIGFIMVLKSIRKATLSEVDKGNGMSVDDQLVDRKAVLKSFILKVFLSPCSWDTRSSITRMAQVSDFIKIGIPLILVVLVVMLVVRLFF